MVGPRIKMTIHSDCDGEFDPHALTCLPESEHAVQILDYLDK